MNDSERNLAVLRVDYEGRFRSTLKPLAVALGEYLELVLKGQMRIDRISVRPKAIDSFLNKAAKRDDYGRYKYEDPFTQIQDQVGARIVVFFKSDVDRIDGIIGREFRAIEEKDRRPTTEWEFGYFGRHRILKVPSDVVDQSWPRESMPEFFELQIKTLFQHAWAEAEHDLGYKEGDVPLNSEQKRRLAFTSAQAWGADEIFDELATELRCTGVAGN